MLLLGAEIIADESGGVDTHEGDQRAEIQKFGATLVVNPEGADQHDGADKNDVVSRDAILRLDRAEKLLGNSIAAAHSIQQARGSELRAHPGTNIGDENREIQKVEEKKTAGSLSHERKRRLDHVLWEWLRSPDELRGINLERGQNAGDQADEYGGEHDVPAGILDLFGKCGDGVEADVGEYGDGGATENATETESFRVVKRLGEKAGTVFVQAPDETNYECEKDDDHDGHSGGEHIVDARGSLDAAKVERGERKGKADGQHPVRDAGQDVLRELAANHGADERVEDVIHHHGPASDVAERGMNFLPHVGIGGAGAGIGAGHFAVADGGE